MYEHKRVPPISRGQFIARLARHGLVAVGVICASLAVGVVGFHVTEGYSWLDSYVNAAMLLGGMGQVGALNSVAGKAFAGTYALYAGLVVIVVMGLMLAPVIHRVMHKYHWDEAK
ncbi:MAG: hypothetical protein HY275_18690 [Gemmatimonadetes bacterium]|nr:hypothetical protein [Gemmatimonadota bacterium]